MRIVFFGTPPFAERSLHALLTAGREVAGVVTQPDRAQGRSRSTLTPPPVKRLAEKHHIPVLQPERPTGDVFVASLRRLEPDLGVVAAYGHILRPEVLRVPRHGFLNVHASLLPRYRGAAPVPWAILGGETETGISIMQMEAGLDSGPVLLRVATPIAPDETGGNLLERLGRLGAEALLETLAQGEAHGFSGEPQDPTLASWAPKVTRDTARLDWTVDAESVSRAIRAFDPAPGAWTTLNGLDVKLFRGAPTEGAGEPGTVLTADDRLVIAAGRDAVAVSAAQPAGRRRGPIADWVHGRGVRPGDRFQ